MPLAKPIARFSREVLAAIEYRESVQEADQPRIDDLEARPARAWLCLECGREREPGTYPCECGGLPFTVAESRS